MRLPSRISRPAAFVLDATLVSLLATAVHPFVGIAVSDVRSWPLAALPGILAMGVLAGLGTSPGKRAFGLGVRAPSGLPGMGKGIVRELVRFLSLPVFVLPILYAVSWISGEDPPYDRFLGLHVGDRTPFVD